MKLRRLFSHSEVVMCVYRRILDVCIEEIRVKGKLSSCFRC